VSDTLQLVKQAIEQQNGKRRFASPADAFRWLRIPGMELGSEPAIDSTPQPPIVNRCWCGKPISKGRQCCKDCKETELKQVAACLTTYEGLEMFLQSYPVEDREPLLTELQPYLKITDFVEEVAWRCDCGESGSIHVRQENQPDNAVIQMALEFHHNTNPDCPIVGVESKGCSAGVARENGLEVRIMRLVVAEDPDGPVIPEDSEWVLDTE
jgi:hypothetical protein